MDLRLGLAGPDDGNRWRSTRGIWAKNLIVSTGKVLLDREMNALVIEEIREVIATGSQSLNTKLIDLHVWRVGKDSYSCAMSLLTSDRSLPARSMHRLN